MTAKLSLRLSFLLLLLSGLVLAHEEPPKSSADLADQDRIRLRFSAAKIKSETLVKTVYGADGKVTGQHISTLNQYDRDGRQVRASEYDSLGILSGSLEHVYGLNHELLEQLECDRDSTCERTVFVYRPDHLMSQATDLTATGSPKAVLEYSYPEGDTTVHLIKRDSSQNIIYSLDYFFHPNRTIGYVVRAVKRSLDGKVIVRTEQTGDSHGLVEKRVIGPDGKTTVLYKYTRREDGQLQRMIRYGADGRIAQTSDWQFGPHDLPTRQTTADSLGHVLFVIEYQYDSW